MQEEKEEKDEVGEKENRGKGKSYGNMYMKAFLYLASEYNITRRGGTCLKIKNERRGMASDESGDEGEGKVEEAVDRNRKTDKE